MDSRVEWLLRGALDAATPKTDPVAAVHPKTSTAPPIKGYGRGRGKGPGAPPPVKGRGPHTSSLHTFAPVGMDPGAGEYDGMDTDPEGPDATSVGTSPETEVRYHLMATNLLNCWEAIPTGYRAGWEMSSDIPQLTLRLQAMLHGATPSHPAVLLIERIVRDADAHLAGLPNTQDGNVGTSTKYWRQYPASWAPLLHDSLNILAKGKSSLDDNVKELLVGRVEASSLGSGLIANLASELRMGTTTTSLPRYSYVSWKGADGKMVVYGTDHVRSLSGELAFLMGATTTHEEPVSTTSANVKKYLSGSGERMYSPISNFPLDTKSKPKQGSKRPLEPLPLRPKPQEETPPELPSEETRQPGYALLYGPARAIIEGTEPLHKHLLEGLLSMVDRQSELTNGDELRPTDAQLAGTQLDLLRELTHEMPHTTRAVGSLLAPQALQGYCCALSWKMKRTYDRPALWCAPNC
jgi:hypothetical protein